MTYNRHSLDKNKVVIAMSGGVDSTAAAYLLKKQGYDVIGMTMLLFDTYDEKGNLIENQSIMDAKKVSRKLGINHHILDLRQTFKKEIIHHFKDEYQMGRTPNPCVRCNRLIKFGALLDAAKDLGAYYLATGHYAKIVYDEDLLAYRVFKGEASGKDQAYMFHVLNQEVLKHIKFPLGKYQSKEEIRRIVEEIDLDISKKGDSQDICFIPDDDYVKYLTEDLEVKSPKGKFVTPSGKIYGEHKGIIHYTIGQRRGLGIAIGKPAYVISIDATTNKVVIGDNIETFKKGFIGGQYNFLRPIEIDQLRVHVKIRYSAKPALATIQMMNGNKLKVTFDALERAITPGQAVVFYIDNEVIGGVTVDEVF